MRIVIVETADLVNAKNYVLGERGITYVFTGPASLVFGSAVRQDCKAWMDSGVPWKVVPQSVAQQLVAAPAPGGGPSLSLQDIEDAAFRGAQRAEKE